jgi:succinoglycan biosynthesis protein ExoL
MATKVTVLIIGHDMQDSRFHRRIRMFRKLGHEVAWAAYDRQRTGSVPSDISQLSHCVLGKTFDRNYFQRARALVGGIFRLRRWRMTTRFDPQIVYCINLDNLALGAVIHFSSKQPVKFLYEVADIQPAFLKGGPGTFLRMLEKFALRHTDILITTSPAFIREYFVPRLGFSGKWFLLENKVYWQNEKVAMPQLPDRVIDKNHDRPIRIGIFGMFRCQRTIQLAAELSSQFPSKLKFVFRGLPNQLVKQKFEQLLKNKQIEYHGPYKYPDDLLAIFSDVDLIWSLDFTSLEGNSLWLLTNRNYEAGLFAVPQLALNGTETGRFVASNKLGCVVGPPVDVSLREFFDSISLASLNEMSESIAAQDRYRFRAESDFKRLNSVLGELLNGAEHNSTN